METQEIQSLTPLRGLAAIWVVCFHYGVVYFAFHPEQFSWIFNKGYLAVDMFFMLSGFVLSHVYWRTFVSDEALRAKDYWNFIGARIARLYPSHLFNLGLFLIVTLGFGVYDYICAGKFDTIPLHGARSLTALLANLVMLQGLKASDLAWNYPAWSISVEFLAYFLFPLALPFIALAEGRKRRLLAGMAFFCLCLFAYLANGDFNQWNGPMTLLRCLPEFIVGALLYAGFRESSWPDWLKWDSAIVAIFWHFSAPAFRYSGLDHCPLISRRNHLGGHERRARCTNVELHSSGMARQHFLLALFGAWIRAVCHDKAACRDRRPEDHESFGCEISRAAHRHVGRNPADSDIQLSASRGRRPFLPASALAIAA